ncbi:hypothetical protein ACFOG5_24145 [Pedobacter fastidiosus]|uniref:Phage integrase SAM-like domain-containing protein n=1 Tax=Pedobacter fastidiosus TaxID=2765361 RepID=A0ABR7KX95_9SPHI|nr:hypothetical protein [Pedobacter fastidiosus]MBC6112737.1 hypothetical protein [Pedobacter fastidiosus]
MHTENLLSLERFLKFVFYLMMLEPVEYLHFLEGKSISVLEVRFKADANDRNSGHKISWITIEEKRARVRKLTLRSQDFSGEIAERFFEEGYLKYNGQTGTYIEKFNSAQHHLTNSSVSNIPKILKEAIDGFLTAQA